MNAISGRDAQGQAVSNAGVQTIQSTVLYEPYSSSEDDSTDTDTEFLHAGVNAARAPIDRQAKTQVTRSGRVIREPRKDITAPAPGNQRIMKPRKERRAEELPVMKAHQEGTYEEVADLENDQSESHAEGVENHDQEMQDIEVVTKPKVPTTTLRKEIKEARKRGDISKEAVIKNVLDVTV